MGKNRILLGDGDPGTLTKLERALHDVGYEVSRAETGSDVIALARRDVSFDLAVLDVELPQKDGLDVADWLRTHTRIPFLFLASRGDCETVRQAVAKGALAYLVKPIESAQLLPALVAAQQRGLEIQQMREQEQQLNAALSGSRHISAAVGLLMERHRLGQDEAFERLRNFARSQRRKLADVAEEFVKAAEQCNLIRAASNTQSGTGNGGSSGPMSSLG